MDEPISSKCDICLGGEGDVNPSPQLLPLLSKHLSVFLNKLKSCTACGQLLFLWDDFSQQAKTNLAISHPSAVLKTEAKTSVMDDATLACSAEPANANVIKDANIDPVQMQHVDSSYIIDVSKIFGDSEDSKQTTEDTCIFSNNDISPSKQQHSTNDKRVSDKIEAANVKSDICNTNEREPVLQQHSNLPDVCKTDNARIEVLNDEKAAIKVSMTKFESLQVNKIIIGKLLLEKDEDLDSCDLGSPKTSLEEEDKHESLNSNNDAKVKRVDSDAKLPIKNNLEKQSSTGHNNMSLIGSPKEATVECLQSEVKAHAETKQDLENNSSMEDIITSGTECVGQVKEAKNINTTAVTAIQESPDQVATKQLRPRPGLLQTLLPESPHLNSFFEPVHTPTSANQAKWPQSVSTAKRSYANTKKIHFPENGLPCPTCNSTLPTQISMHNHMMQSCIQNKNSKFICAFCSKRFNSKTGLSYHLMQHFTELSSFPCDKCGKVLNTDKGLKKHLYVYHRRHTIKSKEETLSSCVLCKKEFPNNELLQHIISCRQNKQPVVLLEQCSDIKSSADSSDQNQLIDSVDSKVTNKTTKCVYCQKVFFNKGNLGIHIQRFHTITKSANPNAKYQCKFCTRRFLTRSGMNLHQNHHKNTSEETSEMPSVSNSTQVIQEQPEKSYSSDHPQQESKTFETELDTRIGNLISNGRKSNTLSESQAQVRMQGGILKQFECQLCNKKFELRSGLLRHLSYHSGSEAFALKKKIKDTVPVQALNKVDLKPSQSEQQNSSEVNTHEDNGVFGFTCDFCNKTFDKQKSLAGHLCCHKENKSFDIKDKDQLIKLHTMHLHHSDEDKNVEMQTANNISNSSKNEESNSLHNIIDKKLKLRASSIAQPKTDKEISCYICLRKMRNSSQLKSHVLFYHIKSTNSKIVCNICGYRFYTNTSYNNHMQTHKNVKTANAAESNPKLSELAVCKGTEYSFGKTKFSCKVCLKSFSGLIGFKRHTRYAHSYTSNNIHGKNMIKKSIFSCNVCSKICHTKPALIQHGRVHKEAKSPVTEYIPTVKKTVQPSKQKIVFPCKICGKVWRTQVSLSQHMRMHKNSQLRVAEEHMSETKSTVCKICSKICLSSAGLVQHMRAHRNIEYQGGQKESTIETVAPSADIQCDYCHLKFPSESTLRTHFQIDHNMEGDMENVTNESSVGLTVNEAKEREIVPDAKLNDLVSKSGRFSEPLECKHCYKTFITKGKLHIHLVNMHPKLTKSICNSLKKYKCKHCSKQLANLWGLNKHLRSFHLNNRAINQQ